MRRALVILATCLALAACTSIPTSGDVRPGDTDVVQPGAIPPILTGPGPNATPRSIVQGFLTAAAGGSVSGFDVAREFLTGPAALEWDPLAQVTVFDSRQVVPSYNEDNGTFTYSVPVAAEVDASGVMVTASADVRKDLEFKVGIDEFGRYRITALDDGMVMSAANFERFFRPVSLYFAAANGATQVPEVRWFADNDQIATAAARELVEGPSAWLAGGVQTGFPPGSALGVDSVVVTDGVANVALALGSAGDPAQRSLAQQQMLQTLTQLPLVQDVVTTVGAVALGGDASVVLEPAALPGEQALVVVDGRLALWDGEATSVTPSAAGVVPETADGFALGFDGTTVAFQWGGSVHVSTALAAEGGLVAADDAEPPVEGAIIPSTEVIPGTGMVAPSFDVYGWMWSTEAVSEGVLAVAAPEQDTIEIAAPWLAGSSVQSVAVSRDGARLAILSRSGVEQVLEVVSIARHEDGRPLAVGEPLAFGSTVRPSIDLEWVDGTSVVALGEESGEMALVGIGGWTTDFTTYAGAVSVTARNGVRTLKAVSADGELVARSGNGWAPKLSGVRDVAYAG
ncbi:LpqB family beta-propeller domain-containing protein [Demequina sp.]|uniref:GerMN domain-containing protein n=1 Tax=Demequina sp. TaxID=2050685 RepID=UPI0025C1DCD0|nr:LpqB family beta-propeller domain-containing protein [Demequina sp.]